MRSCACRAFMLISWVCAYVHDICRSMSSFRAYVCCAFIRMSCVHAYVMSLCVCMYVCAFVHYACMCVMHSYVSGCNENSKFCYLQSISS